MQSLFGQKCAQPVELALPRSAVIANPLFQSAKAGALDAAGPHAAQLFGVYKPRLFQNLQMLGDRGERDAQRLRQPRNRSGAGGEPVENGAARGVAERMKQPGNIDSRIGRRIAG